MFKVKVTKKKMREKYPIILAIPYCSLQGILDSQNAVAYSTRVEGWACDYYEFETPEFSKVLISEGYSPIGDHVSYDLCKEYNEKAHKIRHDLYTGSWDAYREAIEPLLQEFLHKALEELGILDETEQIGICEGTKD